MNNRIKILLILVILLGGTTFLTRSIVEKAKEETTRITALTNSLLDNTSILKNELKTLKTDEITSDQLLHVLPNKFDWSRVVIALDQYEMIVGIDAIKNITDETRENFPLYSNLPEYILITPVLVEFTVDNNDYYKINQFIREIQSQDQLVVVEGIQFRFLDDVDFSVRMKLLYFTFNV
ncbi:hypothetical protein KHQ82_08130 [Mycoplasmatota bacterium]|nr:hypothetical protein KHQ82_08130 [Mycoplasmatota bacterium]